MGISAVLARYVVGLDYEDLDADAIEAAKKSLLDAVGVSLAATGLSDACRPFTELAIRNGGRAESSLIGYQPKVPMAAAAFANGALAHALDFEDAHDQALVHPNAAAVPAALAAAEASGEVTGRKLIAALAGACDLVCRLGLAFTKNPIEYGWYPPPILGAFGAAAAVGKLLDLDGFAMVDAFSLTLCQATCSAELRFSPNSDLRAVRDAFAAQAGIQAALLARQGVRGFDAPFEGQAGLFRLYADGNYAPERLSAELGKRFEGAQLSYKPWPACRGTHAFIEAALSIMKEHPLDLRAITGIHALISPLNRMLCEPAESKRHPATVIDAKFSLPFTVATALTRQSVGLDDFLPAALTEPRRRELAALMSYEIDDSIALEDSTQGALEIRTHDGNFFKQIKIPFGNPRHPISKAMLEEKFFDCAARARQPIDKARLRAVVEMIWNLEQLSDVGEVMDYFK